MTNWAAHARDCLREEALGVLREVLVDWEDLDTYRLCHYLFSNERREVDVTSKALILQRAGKKVTLAELMKLAGHGDRDLLYVRCDG